MVCLRLLLSVECQRNLDRDQSRPTRRRDGPAVILVCEGGHWLDSHLVAVAHETPSRDGLTAADRDGDVTHVDQYAFAIGLPRIVEDLDAGWRIGVGMDLTLALLPEVLVVSGAKFADSAISSLGEGLAAARPRFVVLVVPGWIGRVQDAVGEIDRTLLAGSGVRCRRCWRWSWRRRRIRRCAATLTDARREHGVLGADDVIITDVWPGGSRIQPIPDGRAIDDGAGGLTSDVDGGAGGQTSNLGGAGAGRAAFVERADAGLNVVGAARHRSRGRGGSGWWRRLTYRGGAALRNAQRKYRVCSAADQIIADVDAGPRSGQLVPNRRTADIGAGGLTGDGDGCAIGQAAEISAAGAGRAALDQASAGLDGVSRGRATGSGGHGQRAERDHCHGDKSCQTTHENKHDTRSACHPLIRSHLLLLRIVEMGCIHSLI